MRGIAQLLNTLLQLAGVHLQPWMAPVALLALAILLFPALRRTHRTSLARKRLRRLPYVGAEERRRLEEEALALSTGSPAGLLVVAQEALRLGRHDLARRAADAIEALGARPRELRAIRRALEPQLEPTPAQERVHVEALVQAGLHEEAARRRDLARARWPGEEWPDEAPAEGGELADS
jgi:hypothetical protein